MYKALNKCTLDMETVEAMTKAGDEWNGTAFCANLVDICDMLFVDSTVRNYATSQYREHVASSAILAGSRFTITFVNLFMRFSKPKVPAKMFTNEDDVIQ